MTVGSGVGAGWTRRDVATLIGLLALAALLRLPNLATRGTWDGDQGHDMLVLRAFVRDGVVPLLGPPTSIGDVHHGAWYYYLLSPAAFVTGGDSPLAVVALIAAAGVAAVGVVWALARSIAGPIAGIVAGVAIAVSAAAIDESTFIWNPNLIALSSAVALTAAWRAWSGGRSTWWVIAAIGTAVTLQCHVLGIALLPVIGALFLLDARRRPLGREAIAGVLVLLIAYLPLLVNELTTGFSEVNAALDYLSGGREPSATAIPIRFGIVGLRVVSWPLVGLITDGFVVAVVATCAVIGIVAWAWRRPDVAERPAADPSSGRSAPATTATWMVARWLGIGLLWSAAALTIAAPSLATVIPGLPNDHYHAFADPMVFVLVGMGAAMAMGGGLAMPAGTVAIRGRVAVAGLVTVAGLVALIGWNLTHLPPPVHPDGGYPAGQATGDRVDATLSAAGYEREDPVLLRSLPDFKSTEAVAYPLALRGRSYVAETPKGLAPGSVDVPASAASGALVLLCDDRFADAIGAHCGGPAEDEAVSAGGVAGWGPLLDRFEAAPGRFVSVYGAVGAALGAEFDPEG
ncbi:MAG: glycosyltransferase family 39 protein [Chloroflexota bacterium]|nr:glycosyltransferase family 39 protein [Chloroflexota bacterium]